MTWIGWSELSLSTSVGPRSPSVAAGVVSGLFAAGAVLAALVGLRRHVDRPAALAVTTGALLLGQSVIVALPVIAHRPRSPIEVVALALAAALGACVVGAALLAVRRAPWAADDSFGIGLGMGLVASAHLILLVPLSTPGDAAVRALVTMLTGTHVAAATVVVGTRLLPRRMAWLVVASVVAVAVEVALTVVGHPRSWASVVVSLVLAVVGAAWLATTWDCVQDSLRRGSDSTRPRDDALAISRTQREQLHELRSTVAGLVNGSALLDHADLDDASRARILESVRRELHRMQRLLSEECQQAAQIDLDQALATMVDLQELKGRRVELRSDGALVRARYDALAEVLNILVDNAASHGGTDDSLIEVAQRDDDTVDITVTDFGRGIPPEDREAIFEWGGRRVDSPGEGIGLHVAQRLVTEDGGSLRLRETEGAGSSFVISLPSPRRSSENHLDDRHLGDGHLGDGHLGEEDVHAAWRRSG